MSKKKQNFNFLHHVDDKHEIVYVYVRSWLGSMAAQTKGKELWPDYQIRNASQDLVEYLNEENV